MTEETVGDGQVGGAESEERVPALTPARASDAEEEGKVAVAPGIEPAPQAVAVASDEGAIAGMKVEVDEIGPFERVLRIEVPAKEVESEIDRLYADLERRAVVPGFRKGKIPKEIMRARFGAAVEEEAIEAILPRAYRRALLETSLVPVGRTSIDTVEFSSGEKLTFAARFEIIPEIEVSGYRGLRLKKHVATVEYADVDARLEVMRHVHATYEDVRRPAKEGDLVIIDYETFDLEGKALSDGKISNYPVELVAGSERGEFEESLIGAMRGEIKQIPISYPEDYSQKELAGKTVRFVVSVREIKEKHLPPLDDAFARSIGEFEGLGELREKMRASLEADEAVRQRRELDHQIVERLLEVNPLEPPQAMVEVNLEALLRDARAGAERDEGKADDIDEVELRAQYKPLVERGLKRALLFDQIAATEGIRGSDEELDAHLEVEAKRFNVPPATYRHHVESTGQLESKRDVLTREKVLDLIIDEAEVETVPVRRSER